MRLMSKARSPLPGSGSWKIGNTTAPWPSRCLTSLRVAATSAPLSPGRPRMTLNTGKNPVRIIFAHASRTIRSQSSAANGAVFPGALAATRRPLALSRPMLTHRYSLPARHVSSRRISRS